MVGNFFKVLRGLGSGGRAGKAASAAASKLPGLPSGWGTPGAATSAVGPATRFAGLKAKPIIGPIFRNPKKKLFGLGLLGAVGGLGYAAGREGESTNFEATQAMLDAVKGTGLDYDTMLEEDLAALRGAYAGVGDGGAQGRLNEYLSGLRGYSQAQGEAIERGYSDLSASALRQAEEAAAESQMAATDIDRLYGGAADDIAGYGAGQGLTTGASDVSGLAGVSGAMAEAPDTTRTYGQSLADWMGRQGITQRQDLEAAAQSYLAQGTGTRAQLAATTEGQAQRAQFELGQQLAEIARQNQQQLQAQEAALRGQYREAGRADQLSQRDLARQAAIAAVRAPELWDQIKNNPGLERIAKGLKITNAQELADRFMSEPESLTYFAELFSTGA
jgi:hypothetical protein